MTERTYGIRELANFVLDIAQRRNIQLTNMSLNKLVFFAYEHALLKYNKKITAAKIEAWEHGPVFREIYRSFSDFGNRPITSRAHKYNAVTDEVEIVTPGLSTEDIGVIEEALAPLMHLKASVLRELSHASDGPWAAIWHHEDPANPGMHISDDVIRDNHNGNPIQ